MAYNTSAGVHPADQYRRLASDRRCRTVRRRRTGLVLDAFHDHAQPAIRFHDGVHLVD
jgi:hypothetical protein